MTQLNHEQRQRLFNYFAEAHDLLLMDDDFRMIDDLICSQHNGKPIVSGSLPVDITIKEIENAMERWHLGRDNDDETLKTINDALVKIGLLGWFNRQISR